MSTRYTYEQPEYLDVEGAKFLVAEIKEYINLVITGGVDLSTYATKEYVDNAVSNVSVDLSDYATKQYVDNAIANSGGNTDEPTEPSEPEDTTVSLAISGNASLKVGFSRTYTANYTDSTSTNVSDNYTTTWTITPTSNGITASDVGVEDNGNSITLLVENEDLVDETFTLTATPSDATISPATIDITVVSVF